jgi:hypothetical protein
MHSMVQAVINILVFLLMPQRSREAVSLMSQIVSFLEEKRQIRVHAPSESKKDIRTGHDLALNGYEDGSLLAFGSSAAC